MNTCKICNSPTTKIFSKTILKKYPADYFRCTHCDFVQTSDPVWIDEAYSSAITSLDLGLLGRNVGFSSQVAAIIDACFPEVVKMLDYAGGYGVFVRLMRDMGFDFYRQDPYCENVFTKHFDITDTNSTTFGVLTAFEVFEHFVNPLEEIEKMLKLSDNLIFSTQLLPNSSTEVENWWYIAPETGQHVAFYSPKSMQVIAEKFGKNYYCKNDNLHVLTAKEFTKDQIDYAFNDIRYRTRLLGFIKQKIDFHVPRQSLLERDFQYVKNIINS